jgi:hypothetical protein
MSVGMAEVFHTFVAPSPDVLMIVAMRNTRLRTSRTKGKVSHSQRTEIYISLSKALPGTIVLLEDDLITFVNAEASLSK